MLFVGRKDTEVMAGTGPVVPDFFMVGAPKSGTTAMTEYLRRHPDVFMPVKELHFFGSDLSFKPPMANFHTHPRSPEETDKYLDFFESSGNVKRVGESSVFYLYSTKAARELKEMSPSAKIIIMLRNPVDMLYSLHSQYLYDGNEDIAEFDQALQAEEARKKGMKIPPSAHFPAGLYYTEVVRYAEQVERYLDAFGGTDVKVIIFDDFNLDTAGVYRELLDFLGLNGAFQPSFEIINPNKKVRSKVLAGFLKTPPDPLKQVGVRIFLRGAHRSLKRGLQDLNTRVTQRPAMDTQLRQALVRRFSPEVRRLGRLLHRDLTIWLGE
jgi:hypothetical protein